MTSRTITCSECGNNDNKKMFITEDGRYSVCNICGARTTLYSDYVIQEHTGHVEVEGIAGKQARLDSASHLITLGEFDRAKKLFERLTDDYSDSSESWYGLARAVSCDFTATRSNAVAVPALEHAMHNARPDAPAYRAAQGARDFLVRKQEKEAQIQALTAESAEVERRLAAGPREEDDVKRAHELDVAQTKADMGSANLNRKTAKKAHAQEASAVVGGRLIFLILLLLFAMLLYTGYTSIKDITSPFHSYVQPGVIYYRVFNSAGQWPRVAPWWPFIGALFTLILMIRNGRNTHGHVKQRRTHKQRVGELNSQISGMGEALRTEHQRLEAKIQPLRAKLDSVAAQKTALSTQLNQAKAEYEGMAQYRPIG